MAARGALPGAFLLVVACLRPAAGAPQSASWIPASATFAAHVDVAALTASAAFAGVEDVLEAQDGRGDVERFRELTGMDPWRDVYTLTYFSQPADEADGEALWGIAATGAFDAERVLESLGPRGGIAEIDHHETPLYVAAALSGPRGAKPHAFALVYGDTLLFGPKASVERMLDVGDGREPSTSDGPLARALDRISDAASFWVVSSGETRLGSRLPAGVAAADSIPGLRSFSLTARLVSGLSLRLEGEAEDDAAAAKLADVVRGVAAYAAMAPSSGLADLSQTLEVETSGSKVEVSFDVERDTIRDWLREQRRRLEPSSP